MRIVRRVPSRALEDWRRAFLAEDKIISLGLALLTSWIGLRTAALPKIVEGLNGWADAASAFVYVSMGWLLVCVARAPYSLVMADRRDGTWHGNRYVFHQPRLMGSIRAKPTGAPEFYRLDTSFAEPDAFLHVNIMIDRDVPTNLYSANVVSNFLVSSIFEPGRGLNQGGTLLDPKVGASLVVVMVPEAEARTFSVYCIDFSLGNPDHRDGALGNANPAWIREKHPRARED